VALTKQVTPKLTKPRPTPRVKDQVKEIEEFDFDDKDDDDDDDDVVVVVVDDDDDDLIVKLFALIGIYFEFVVDENGCFDGIKIIGSN
jgi:hypothetical protein